MKLDELKGVKGGRWAYLLGNGPSLLTFDLNKIPTAAVVISMNRSWRIRPGDYHCLLPGSNYLKEIRKANWVPNTVFYCGSWSSLSVGINYNRWVVVPQREFRLPPQDGPAYFDLRQGFSIGNAGEFAILCAIWLGCDPIYLLGYDGYGKHFSSTAKSAEGSNDLHNAQFIRQLDQITLYKPEQRIYNCNSASLYCFTKRRFSKCLHGNIKYS